MSDRIVVVGGGFAGFWAAVAARRIAPEIDITLVSRDAMLQMRPRLYEASPERLQIDLRPLLASVDVQLICGCATTLDERARSVRLRHGERLSYRRLVVATGSVLRRPRLPGVAAAHSIDTVADAVAFDRRLAELVSRSKAPTIVVVGAGFTGIELALELRDRIAGHGSRHQAERARIVLVDQADVVGPELGPAPRPVIEAALDEAGIERRLGVPIASFALDRINLADGETLVTDAVVLTTGMRAADFAAAIPGEHDQLGRVIVDQSLRALSVAEVFVAGDAAAADGGDGHLVLQSCQHALQLGRVAGENAARDLLGLPLLAYVQPPYVTCLDLGRSGAVFTRGWDRTVSLTGERAKAVKRRINTEVIYPPRAGTRRDLLRMSNVDPSLQRARRTTKAPDTAASSSGRRAFRTRVIARSSNSSCSEPHAGAMSHGG